MWKNERHQRISRIIQDLNRVSTDQLVVDLAVSRETIRRDLLDMECLGLLRRVHGGAVAIIEKAEPPLNIRKKLYVKEKKAIAKAACGLITDHKVVFFDAGTTTIQLAEQLVGLHNLHVITNSIKAASSIYKLKHPSVTVTLLGGNLDPFGFATAGSQTIREISKVTADLAFVSPTAIDIDRGALSSVQEEAEIAAAMLENSREKVILADSTKFAAHGNFKYCNFEQIDALVTDSNIHKTEGLADLVGTKVNKLIIA